MRKYLPKNNNPYVHYAVEDLRNDFRRVSVSCIVIDENTTNSCTPIKDEGFTIKTENNVIRISASGYLGTMWGIYTFSEKYLGVDPC